MDGVLVCDIAILQDGWMPRVIGFCSQARSYVSPYQSEDTEGFWYELVLCAERVVFALPGRLVAPPGVYWACGFLYAPVLLDLLIHDFALCFVLCAQIIKPNLFDDLVI